jgi:hypothetical protein
MAAGLGFKTFATGDVLTAGDTNGYLMQGIWVFANATARTAAVTSPQEGNMSFLKDTNSTEYYDGSAWVAVGGGGAGGINPNIIINGNFTVNQRAYVSAASLASGSYGFDRWKSNAAGTALTFTAAPYGQTISINSTGGITQIIEQANVPAGSYVLSWSGTATARIYNVGATPPSYAASPITFTADGLADVQVDFTASGGTRTCGLVKLEIGSTPSTFIFAGNTIEGEFANCQRYYYRNSGGGVYNTYGVGISASAGNATISIPLPTRMRIAPTSIDYSNVGITDNVNYQLALSNLTIDNASPSSVTLIAATGTGQTQYRPAQLTNQNTTSGYIGLSAEL